LQAGAASITGFDIVGPWLAEARKTVPTATLVPVAALTELAAIEIPLMDVVFLLETLEHVPRRAEVATLGALTHILKPGGRLILSTPAAGIAALADPAWLLVGHRHYCRRTVEHLAREAGFEALTVCYSGDIWESADVALLYLYKHILRRPYRSPTVLHGAEERVSRHRRLDSNTIWLQASMPQGSFRTPRA
jgi:SAM-dependent methyltransferase